MKKLLVRQIKTTEEIGETLSRTEGYCPCKTQRTPENKCMCKEFKNQKEPGICHCGFFEKYEEEFDNL